VTFKLVEEDDWETLWEEPPSRPSSRETYKCDYCGRFVKNPTGTSYYNGTWDCYRLSYECSKCGSVDIECV
jgi:hypothetical protein